MFSTDKQSAVLSRASVTKKTNPTGVRYPMTRAWKALVVDRMVARNLSRAELARQLGVTRGALTQFFGVDQQSSTLVPEVARLLELPMPTMNEDDELAQLVAALSPDDRSALLVLARQLVKGRRQS